MYAKDAEKLNVDTTDPEDDYFQIMKNMSAEQKKVICQYIIFQQFLFQKPRFPYGVVFLLFIGLYSYSKRRSQDRKTRAI